MPAPVEQQALQNLHKVAGRLRAKHLEDDFPRCVFKLRINASNIMKHLLLQALEIQQLIDTSPALLQDIHSGSAVQLVDGRGGRNKRCCTRTSTGNAASSDHYRCGW